jgi:preprotein translocase subunit SecE
MARQTRAQRRARRERDGAAQAPAVSRAAAARPAPTPAPAQARPQRRGVGGFVRESWGELQKVEWPRQQQLIQGVVVVLVACVVVGVYLWLSDIAFRHLVQQVFLGQ